MSLVAALPRNDKIVRLAVFAAVTVAIIVAARRLDWPRAIQLLATARPAWLLVAVLSNTIILICWALFWRALRPRGEGPVSYGRMFEIVSASSSLMNTVPFGGGHASSVVLLATHGNITQRGAVSVFALDQLGEGVTKVSLFLLVGFLVPLPTWMRAGTISAALAVGILFIVLMVASRWASELAILKSWRRSATALVSVVGMKLFQALAIAAVQHAFGVDLSAGATMLVFAAVILGTMVPLAPGNLGTYEASAFLAYRYLGIAPEQALSLAIMQHACFMLPSVGIGYVFLSRHTLLRRAIASR
ncbi:MAG: Lysylphosphatidylglycerol synthetase/glycosyltransferase AglD [Gemmatimonadetes bacterium]|nr:Lysylphosphatidylglycerol synthetase/glycosyltransferase AglD [Gemmatimonadota bacterium]